MWTAVGGRGTLIGPIIGALMVNAGKSYFTGAFPALWHFALGGVFIGVTLFLPKGIVGTIQQKTMARRDIKTVTRAEERGVAATLGQAAE